VFRLSGKTTLAASAESVSAFLADVSNESQWQKDIVHVERLEGEAGRRGAKFERVQLVGGRNIKTVNELVEHVPGQRVAYKGAGKVIQYALEYRLHKQGQTTALEMSFEGEMLGFAAMFEGIAAEELRDAIPANFERLQKAVGTLPSG
jgi:hypothetical protein